MENQDSYSLALWSKLAPSEYTLDMAVEWIAKFNNINGLCDLRHLRYSIETAINAGELTYRGNPHYLPMGFCICCRSKQLAELTLSKRDIEQWCRKMGLRWATDDSELLRQRQAEEKEVGKVTREAFLSIVAAQYEVIGYFMRGEAEKLPPYSHLVRSGDITPDGLGKYLTNEFQACSSANERIAEALKLIPK